jgi:hypothetical protein|eukprot:COSAG01_NODE_290_length_19382_cov_22.903801_14_plen_118_part_00
MLKCSACLAGPGLHGAPRAQAAQAMIGVHVANLHAWQAAAAAGRLCLKEWIPVTSDVAADCHTDLCLFVARALGVTCSGCCELSSSAFFRASAFFQVFWLLLIDALNLSQVRNSCCG